jgi:hypothetical protein
MPTWDELIAGDDDNEENTGVEYPGDDASLVSRSQHRLDAELKASGYSREDAARDTELAYYEAHQRGFDRGLGVVDDVDDEEDEDDDSDNEDNIILENENKREQEEIAIPNEERFLDDIERAQDIIDIDDLNIDNDGASIGVSLSGMSRMSRVSTRSQAEVEQIARERVARHLEERKRASGKKGAFKSRNTNKTYAKGRRVGGKPNVSDFEL